MDKVIISGFDREALKLLSDYIGDSGREKASTIKSMKNNTEKETEKNEIEDVQNEIKDLRKVLNENKKQIRKTLKELEKEELKGHKESALQIQKQIDKLSEVGGQIRLNINLRKDELKELKKIQKSLSEQSEEEKKITAEKQKQTEFDKKQTEYLEEGRRILRERRKIYEEEENAYAKYLGKHSDVFNKRLDRAKEGSEIFGTLKGKLEKGITGKIDWTKLPIGKNILESAERYKHLGKYGIATGLVSDALGGTAKKATSVVNYLSSDRQTSISDVGNKVSGVLNNLGPYGQAAGAIFNLITAGVEAYDKINIAASKYTREVGGGVQKMDIMKVDAVHITNSINKWGGLTYKFDKILEHVAELSSKTGRVMDHMSELDFKSLEDLYRHGITSDVIAQYDTFGLSVETIDKRIKSIYNRAGKHGLNAKAVTSAVANNLKIAQNYTFAGGQRALERMAEKSVALKYNMQSVAAFADKVSTLEGAAQAGAGLSVLGGNFARMGNPLSLLYGGLQDAEKLNDMMLNMTRDMAMWDSRNKEMRISAYNRQRLRAASQQMGVSYDELVNQAMMQGKRERINNQLDRTGKITSEDTREYIRNLAQLDENGRAYIRFNGSTENTYLDKLTEKDRTRLAEESRRMEDKQNAKIGDVYEQTRTITDRLNDYIDWIKTKFFDVILRIAGFGDKERGKMRGLNEANAEFFNDMSDDYYHGGMSDAGLRRLSELGATTEEIQRIKKRELSDSEFDDFVLKKIMNKQNEGYSKDISQIYSQNNNNWKYTGKVEKKAHGGIIRGRGTSLSDSIPARLSNGEFVMNAKATQQHLPTLQAWNAQGFNSGTETPIKTGNNSMNLMTVNKPMSTSITSPSVSTPKMTIEPININLSGTIDLRADGFNKKIDADEIFTNEVVSKLIRKIQEATNYRLDKTNVNVHMKYPMV